jgi:hypothetical protein
MGCLDPLLRRAALIVEGRVNSSRDRFLDNKAAGLFREDPSARRSAVAVPRVGAVARKFQN